MAQPGGAILDHGAGLQDRLDRAAPVAFAAFLAVAFVVLVAVGRSGWFSTGDLSILTSPTVDDVFVPVEQHWTTVPLLLFKATFAFAGFRFLPYLVLAVTSHLAVAALVFLVARRSEVRPWIAALVTSLMVLFAPGFLSMIIPIQITQNLSLIGGLAQFLLADHDGIDRRRDALALGAGVIGLMSSGIMPALVLATAFALLVRRGWRAAALQSVPLGVLFVGWYLWRQPNNETSFRYQAPAYDLATHVQTVARGMASAFEALGSWTPLAVLLALVLVVGVVLRLADGPPAEAIRVIAAPLALAFSSVVYLALVAYQRSAGTEDYIEWSHHRYNAIVLCLPALAVAVAALVDRWRALAPVLAALVLVCGAANVRFDEADRPLQLSTGFLQVGRSDLIAAAQDPTLDQHATEDPDGLPFAGSYSGLGAITYVQLRELRDGGKIPDS